MYPRCCFKGTSPSLKSAIIRHPLRAHSAQFTPVNSKLDWNDNLAAIFEAKLIINRLSSSVLFYCISRRGWHYSSGNVPIFDVFISS